MAPQIEEETENYRLAYDSDLDAVIFTWTEFASGEEFRRGANRIVEYMAEHDVEKLLVDTSGIKAHDADDDEWIAEEWTPKLIDAGLTTNCVVYPESAITKMDRDQIKESLAANNYEGYWTADIDDARQWLADS